MFSHCSRKSARSRVEPKFNKGQFNEHAGLFYRAPQIIVTVPVLLDLLLCHSLAWLPREESRSFLTSSSGIRDSSRAPDTRAGMTEKFDRADVRVTILCRT